MSIFQLPLLLVLFSCLLCPVASQPGYTAKEVKSGHCTSAELITTAANCQAAGKMFGLGAGTTGGTVKTHNFGDGATYPPGCFWELWSGDRQLFFNPGKSVGGCSDDSSGTMCLCVDPCPIGNYQNEESCQTCKLCQAGTYNGETGRPSCKGCTIGTFSSEIGLSSQNQCKSCLPGTYNDETGKALCKSCRAGTYNNETGKALCKSCLAGHYQPDAGKTNCEECVAGSYSTEETGALSCTKCLQGTASTTIGASTNSTCIKCIGGQYSTSAGASSCSSCLKGTYSAEVGQSSPDICNAAHDECEDTETNKLIIPLVVGLGIIVAILIEVGVAAIYRSCKIKQKHEVEIGISLLENAHNPLEEDEEEGDGEDEDEEEGDGEDETFESSIA